MSAPIPPGVPPEEDAEARELAPTTETLLDYYARGAMEALIPLAVTRGLTSQQIARDAFEIARAMVRLRRFHLPKAIQ